MRQRVTSFVIASGVSLAIVACGGGGKTVKTDNTVKEAVEGAEKKADESATKAEESDELTVRQVIVPETPKYVDGVDQAAQDQFKEGVVAVYSSPPDYETAVERFTEAVDTDKGFLEAYFNLGMTYERLRKPEKALEIYQKALTNNPDSLDAKAYVARIFLAKATTASSLGNDAEAAQLTNRAKALLDEIVVRDSDNVSGNNALALFYLMKGEQNTAEEFVRKVLSIEPFNTSALNTRGLINYRNKEYRIAKWIFEEKVLRIDPNSTEALTNLGLTYLAMDQKPLAVASFKKAIELDPENIPARLNLAAIYLDYLNYEQARDQFKLVIEQQPDNVEALIGFGTSNWGMQEYEPAVDAYLSVTELTSKHPQLWERLGKIYEGPLGSTSKAIEFYKKYIVAANLPPEHIIVQQVKMLESGAFDNPPPDDGENDGEGDDGQMPDDSMGDDNGEDGGGDDGVPDGEAPAGEDAPIEDAPSDDAPANEDPADDAGGGM